MQLYSHAPCMLPVSGEKVEAVLWLKAFAWSSNMTSAGRPLFKNLVAKSYDSMRNVLVEQPYMETMLPFWKWLIFFKVRHQLYTTEVRLIRQLLLAFPFALSWRRARCWPAFSHLGSLWKWRTSQTSLLLAKQFVQLLLLIVCVVGYLTEQLCLHWVFKPYILYTFS